MGSLQFTNRRVVPTRSLPLYNRLLLNSSQRDQLEVVLVSPRNPLNIGAAARAMANFGFSRLVVVAPYKPHWREAKSAVGAEELLTTARTTESLQEAIADCTLVLGTGTLAHRKPEQPIVSLPSLAPILQGKTGRVALVFGPEKHGLTRDDLALCHHLVEIPTHPGQPSMNLGQAVAVCLYELASRLTATSNSGAPSYAQRRVGEQESQFQGPDDLPATSRDLDLLAEVVTQTATAADYSPAAMRHANRHDLYLLLRRLTLTRSDARRVLGLFRRILWRLQHRSDPHKI
ncbi:MAG: RNA methyltransferase [Terracidiphilus sp.]